MGEGVRDSLPRDLVKDHALRLAERYLGGFYQMPRYGFAFAVRVCGEIDGIRLSRFLGKLFDHFALVVQDAVSGLEVVFDFDAHLAFGKVADVSHRCFGDESASEKALDGSRLRRRFYDYEVFCHLLLRCLGTWVHASPAEYAAEASLSRT